MAFVGLTHTGPQNFFQYHDIEPNEFNEEVKRVCPVDELPEEMRKVGWTKNEVTLADLYPDATPLRQLKKENHTKTRKTTTEYYSAAAYREAMARNSRGVANPQDKWYAPLTSSQTIGWSQQMPGDASGVPRDPRHGKTTSEEAKYAEAMFKQGMI